MGDSGCMSGLLIFPSGASRVDKTGFWPRDMLATNLYSTNKRHDSCTHRTSRRNVDDGPEDAKTARSEGPRRLDCPEGGHCSYWPRGRRGHDRPGGGVQELRPRAHRRRRSGQALHVDVARGPRGTAMPRRGRLRLALRDEAKHVDARPAARSFDFSRVRGCVFSS